MARYISHIIRRLPLSINGDSVGNNTDETDSRPDRSSVASDVAEPSVEATPEIPQFEPRPLPVPVLPLPALTPSSCLPPAVVVEENEASVSSSCQRRHSRRSHRHSHGNGAGGSSRRHRRACRIRWKEVNFMVVMSSVVAAVLVCTSLAEPHWWYVSGGRCRDLQQTVNYLGVRSFFFDGHFENALNDGHASSIYYYSSTADSVLIDCLSQSSVQVIQVIVALCFLVVVFNLAAVVFEMMSFTTCFMKSIKHSAIFPIISVCLCVTINILSFVVTQQLSVYYASTPLHPNSKIDVEFSLSFYTIMAAGVMSVLAVTFAFFCRRWHSSGGGGTPRWFSGEHLQSSRRCREDRSVLIDADYNQLDRPQSGSSACVAAAAASLPAQPPPPPYTP